MARIGNYWNSWMVGDLNIVSETKCGNAYLFDFLDVLRHPMLYHFVLEVVDVIYSELSNAFSLEVYNLLLHN